MEQCPLCLEDTVIDGVCSVCGAIPVSTIPETEDTPNKAIDLRDLNKEELLSIAKGFESITDESHMTKAQLIEAIEAAK